MERFWGERVGEATRLMSGHGLKLFGPRGRFFYRKRRQLGGGVRVGGETEESRMVGGAQGLGITLSKHCFDYQF